MGSFSAIDSPFSRQDGLRRVRVTYARHGLIGDPRAAIGIVVAVAGRMTPSFRGAVRLLGCCKIRPERRCSAAPVGSADRGSRRSGLRDLAAKSLQHDCGRPGGTWLERGSRGGADIGGTTLSQHDDSSTCGPDGDRRSSEPCPIRSRAAISKRGERRPSSRNHWLPLPSARRASCGAISASSDSSSSSLGSIIGAGWLFGALYASSLAGPAAVISWLLGGGVVMLLALTHAELGGMYPVAGGSARFPRYAFGRPDRLHEWLDRVSRRRDRRADHGRSHAPVHVELRLLAHDRLGRPAGADCPGLLRRGNPAACSSARSTSWACAGSPTSTCSRSAGSS